MKFYCELYISECWKDKKEKIISRVSRMRLSPRIYVIVLAAGPQNNLEFYSGILLRQKVFKSRDLFVVGIADGYDECLAISELIADDAYQATGDADIRNYIMDRQMKYEKAGR